LKRRDFISLMATAAAATTISAPAGRSARASQDSSDYQFQSAWYRLALSDSAPEIITLSLDSLGKGKLSANPIMHQTLTSSRNWHGSRTGNSFTYRAEHNGRVSSAGWTFTCHAKRFVIRCTAESGVILDPLTITFNQLSNHATLLGRMEKSRQAMQIPCVLHLPDLGTIRITCNVPGVSLGYDALRFVKTPYVAITFPAATAANAVIEYTFEVTTIYPQLSGIDSDPRYDGFRRNFLNIFQINPRLRVLANNASSDTCAFTVYEYAMVAAKCPPLAHGLSALDILRDTLDRYCDGMLAYGLVGYAGNYEGANTSTWKTNTPYDALDSMPSLLIAACTYIQATGDWNWARDKFPILDAWGRKMLLSDHNRNGLIEYPMSGNHGCYTAGDAYRPANWWDNIGFGHEDAYCNALAYRACVMLTEVAAKIGKRTDVHFFQVHGKSIRAAYYPTFYNPATGLLAGWRSTDGQLHDYQFIFVNSVAVTVGLLDTGQAHHVMDNVLAKIKAAGYNNFHLGLPGNLIAVAADDYNVTSPRWGGGGLKGFQKYENGGATACFCYFTIQALFELGRADEARAILYPMLASFEAGTFQGKGPNAMSKDWKTWKGQCYGYEGFLVDGYLTLLTVFADRGSENEPIENR
jgi:hypothetical protein